VLQEEWVPYVTGEVYENALTKMQLLAQDIEQQTGKGFDSFENCAAWAHDHYMDIIVYKQAQNKLFNVRHDGKIVSAMDWAKTYNDDLLVVKKVDDKGKVKYIPWIPKGTKAYSNPRINSEAADGSSQPLVHRDYFTPKGYYDPIRCSFNIANPFQNFAKNTGEDIWYVYELIKHIGAECEMWLLAWLRAKIIEPTKKTEVVPVILSRAQGTGKTSYANAICKGIFGKKNVLVTEQFDSQARFNVDNADALVISIEEKDETDKRNSFASIKSRATADEIRKEAKGQDPYYQNSYTDYIITTNRDVPFKFDDMNQRRFMVMAADDKFIRTEGQNTLADEVFTKLYGEDGNRNKVGIPFAENTRAVQQLMHDLTTREDIAKVPLHNFPKTDAYHRSFYMPRTTEAVEIDSIIRSLAPFIKASLDAGEIMQQIPAATEPAYVLNLTDYIQTPAAMTYIPALTGTSAMVILCRPIIFYDVSTNKPFAHAVVERTLLECDYWLGADFGLHILPNMLPFPGGFRQIQGRHANAPTARFVLKDMQIPAVPFTFKNAPSNKEEGRIGERLRVNGKWQPDPEGEFETVNEMKPGTTTLANKTQNVQYMDTFLFESDDVDRATYSIEESKAAAWLNSVSTKPLSAQRLFQNRLAVQKAEAERLFKQGIAARVVYSGGKSYHILVRVVDSPQTLEEYTWLHAQLATILSDKLIFDPTTSDPARLTRAPIIHNRTFEFCGATVEGTQGPISTNWNAVYSYTWRPLFEQWKNRPPAPYELKRKMLPMKQEYRDAMMALLGGTFWTDGVWNGQRQRCFFPAYRLCRYLGYTHEMLWAADGILDNLDKYYRSNEVGYWRSRETCDLIVQIDKDEDAREVEA
jgi:hypothetical protein